MVEEGSFCRAQGLYDYVPHRSELKSSIGIIQNIGETAVAFSTLVRFLQSILILPSLILIIGYRHSHLSCGVGRYGHSIHCDNLCRRSGMLAFDCRLGDHWQYDPSQFHCTNPRKSFRFVLYIFQQRLT